MKKVALIILSIFLLTGCEENSLGKIKKSRFDECSNYTLKELIKNYLDNPRWKTVRKDGNKLYEVTGKSIYNGYEEITFQFSNTSKVRLENLSPKYVEEMCKITKIKKEETFKTFKNVEVVTSYNKEMYSIDGNIPETVDVVVYGLKEDIDSFNIDNKIVSLQLYNYSAGDKVKAYFTFNTNKNIISEIKPSYVDVTLNKKVSNVYNVEYEFINKTQSFQYKESEITEVIVKGSDNDLKKVDRVKAIYDLTEIEDTLKNIDHDAVFIIKSKEIAVYDRNGKKMSNLEVVPNSLNIEISYDKGTN